MGLFVNNDQHPHLYKSKEDVQTKNQENYRYDAWTDFLLEQKQGNEAVQQALQHLTQLQQRQAQKHERRWQGIDAEIRELEEINQQRKAFEKSVLGSLEKIEGQQRNGEETLQQIQVAKAEWTEQLEKIASMEKQVLAKLERQEKSQEGLINDWQTAIGAMEEQTVKQQELQQQQEEVVERLERQEALTEKIIREILQIRSVIFERASFLAEKIEHGYRRTSTYVQKMISAEQEDEKKTEPLNK